MQTPPERAVAHAGHLFSADEWHSLCLLRDRYRRDPDLLAEAEKRRLLFWHWMWQVGWLPG